jgi:hypothetical protein
MVNAGAMPYSVMGAGVLGYFIAAITALESITLPDFATNSGGNAFSGGHVSDPPSWWSWARFAAEDVE